MTAPTPDEVAKARAWYESLPPHSEAADHAFTLLAALDAAEREKRDRAEMLRSDLEDQRDAVRRALPKWTWDDPDHDPLHAHPVEQLVGTLARVAELAVARAEKDEARVVELEAGLRALADEYGPSDCRKRCLRLLVPSGSNGGGA